MEVTGVTISHVLTVWDGKEVKKYPVGSLVEGYAKNRLLWVASGKATKGVMETTIKPGSVRRKP